MEGLAPESVETDNIPDSGARNWRDINADGEKTEKGSPIAARAITIPGDSSRGKNKRGYHSANQVYHRRQELPNQYWGKKETKHRGFKTDYQARPCE